MNLRYRVGVAAPLPTGVVAEIERRFGAVRITEGRPATAHGNVLDQAALRGLLTLLWDANADVVSVRIRPGSARTAAETSSEGGSTAVTDA
jgi:hypothetical protein